jgi:NAD-dependent dihydropyrimidine dehydrogenase PreA subunit
MTLSREELLKKIDWGPTLDASKCDGCRTCVELCHQGVWDFVDGKAVVVAKSDCVVGCSHCATLCEQGAISFPSVEDLRRARRGE